MRIVKYTLNYVIRSISKCVKLPQLRHCSGTSGATFEKDIDVVNINKRTSLSKRRKESDLLESLKQYKAFSTTEWDLMRSEAVRNEEVTDLSFPFYCMEICLLQKNFITAQSLISYLDVKNDPPRLQILSSFLQICNSCFHQAGEDLFMKYYNVVKTLSTDIDQDVFMLSYMISGLSKTKNWRECFPLLEKMEKIGRPPTELYSLIASAAFRNAEEDLGWDILERLQIESRIPSNDTIKQWIKFHENDSSLEVIFDKFITYCRNAKLALPEDTAKLIQEIFERRKYVGSYSSISLDGYCKSCKNKLEKVDISIENFNELRDALISIFENNNELIVPNIKEYSTFKQFISETSPYEIVLDGWNIIDYHFPQPNTLSNINKQQRLFQVLKQLTENQNKRILVLCNTFTASWFPEELKKENKNVFYFFTDNLSRIDHLLLYAALSNGYGTMMSCYDDLRDFEILLKDKHLCSFFQDWQWRHRLVKSFNGNNFRLLAPISFKPLAQKTEKSLHIPISDDTKCRPQITTKLPTRWLCLSRQ